MLKRPGEQAPFIEPKTRARNLVGRGPGGVLELLCEEREQGEVEDEGGKDDGGAGVDALMNPMNPDASSDADALLRVCGSGCPDELRIQARGGCPIMLADGLVDALKVSQKNLLGQILLFRQKGILLL